MKACVSKSAFRLSKAGKVKPQDRNAFSRQAFSNPFRRGNILGTGKTMRKQRCPEKGPVRQMQAASQRLASFVGEDDGLYIGHIWSSFFIAVGCHQTRIKKDAFALPYPVTFYDPDLQANNIAALNFPFQNILTGLSQIIKSDFCCDAVQLVQREICS